MNEKSPRKPSRVIRTRRGARHIGQLCTIDDGVRALSLPHAVLIIDPEDTVRYHLFGPYQNPVDAACVAEEFLRTFDYAENLQTRVIPLAPITPPAPERPRPRQEPDV